MHLFLPPEKPSPFDTWSGEPRVPMQSFQSFLTPNTQDSPFPYFKGFRKKSATIFQEDPFISTFTQDSEVPVEITTPGDFTRFGTVNMCAASPLYNASFPRESRFRNNNNEFRSYFESPMASLGSFTELTDLEPFKEAPEGFQKLTANDQFMSEVASDMSDEDFVLERTRIAKEDLFIFQNDPFSDERAFSTADEVHMDWLLEEEKVTRPDKVVVAEKVEKVEKVDKIGTFVGNKGWCEEHEKLLRKLAVQYKFDWKKIAKKFNNKKYTPHFLKMRYKGYDEGPVPKRVKFSHEEDVLIAKYFEEYGVDWEKMVSHFPNRTAIMLKNRFYSHIRKHNLLESLLEESGQTEGDCLKIMKSGRLQTEGLGFSKSRPNRKQTLRRFDKKMEDQESEESEESVNPHEVSLLRAQVKSLKSLYLLAHKELNRIRHNGH
jgi:hypothetical protein